MKFDSKKKKREYYVSVLRTLIVLSIPTILEEILSTLLQYVDTAMVGHLGEKATAAVSTTMTINWLIHAIPAAVAVAALALASKANGAGDYKLLKKISGQAILYGMVTGLMIEVMALALAPYIPIWMGAEKDIQGQASMYFTIISLPLVFRTSSRVFASMIRSIKDTRTPMLISVGENVLNVVLNWYFIYQLSMGVRGAAIASAISFTVGGAGMLLAMLHNVKLRAGLRDIFPDKEIFLQSVRIGMPAMGTHVASCLGYVFFAGMVSGMGTTIFAAHSIAVTAEEIVYIPGYGLRTATSTLVGNALGKRDSLRLKTIVELSVVLTMGIMFLNGVLLYLLAYPLMSMFTSSVAVASLGSQMLKLVSFSEPFFGLMIVLEGVSYGLGHTKNVFFCETFSMWGIRILSTFICVKVLGLGLNAVWLCMIADNICKALLLFIFRPKMEIKKIEKS